MLFFGYRKGYQKPKHIKIRAMKSLKKKSTRNLFSRTPRVYLFAHFVKRNYALFYMLTEEWPR